MNEWIIYEILKDRSRYSDKEIMSIIYKASRENLQNGIIEYLLSREKLMHP